GGAAESRGVNVERHRRHGQDSADGDGRPVEVADREFLRARPAAELVALPDGEGDRRKPDTRVGRSPGLDSQGRIAGATYSCIASGDTPYGRPALVANLERCVEERSRSGAGSSQEKIAEQSVHGRSPWDYCRRSGRVLWDSRASLGCAD